MPTSHRAAYHSPWSWLTRREFLAAGSVSVAGMLFADQFGATAQTQRHVFRVRRDCDLLDLEIEFVNFREVSGRWLQSAAASLSWVIVHFPPQNLAEAIFNDPGGDDVFEVKPLPLAEGGANSPIPPVRSYMSGPSRIVFVVPEGVVLPFTRTPNVSVVDLWLQQLAKWDLYVPPELGKATYTPRPPRWDETCLELPYRLFIAPQSGRVRWLSSAERLPVAKSAVAKSASTVWELWNAQLISRVKLEPAKPPDNLAAIDPNLAPLTDVSLQAKALYSPDYRKLGKEPEGGAYFPGNQQLSLKDLTRHQLVAQMSNGNGSIDIDHLVLTALGADAFLAYFNQKSCAQIIQEQLDNPDQLDKEQNTGELMVWKHRMVVGRDVYIIEARFGVLFPMVYPCLYVQLTQRKFAARQREGKPTNDVVPHGPPGAYLLKRHYIVVVQPEKYFMGSDNALGRSMPIKSAVLGMTKSPDLYDPAAKFPIAKDLVLGDGSKRLADYRIPEKATDALFVPRALNNPTNSPLEWPITFTDESGRTVRTPHATLLFASNVILGQRAWDLLNPDWRQWAVPPQPLALAPEVATLPPVGASKIGHELAHVEHDGIARLGDGLQRWHNLVSPQIDGKADDLKAKDAELQQWRKKPVEFQDQIKRREQELEDEASRVVLAKLPPVQNLKLYFAMLAAAFRELPTVWTGTEDELKRLYGTFPTQALTAKSRSKILRLIEAAQDKLGGQSASAEVLKQIQKTADQIEASLQGVREGTLKELDRGLKNFASPVEEALSNLHARMREAEKISSILEVHNITLGSAITDRYFKQYVESLKDAKIATAQQLYDKCGDIIKGWENEKRTEFKSLIALIDSDRKAILAAGTEANRLAKNYVADLIAAKEKAEKLGAHQFHAVMEQVQGIVPSMKTMMPNYPLQAFTHFPDFVAKGIHDVGNGIFAQLADKQLADPKAQLDSLVREPLAAIKNGLGTPRTLIQGLSNRLGAVAAKDIDQLKALANPLQKKIEDFKNAIPNSKLFGALDLKDLVGALAHGQLPSINLVKTPEKLSHTWKWTLPIDDGGSGKPFAGGIVTYRNATVPTAQLSSKVCLNITIVTTTNLPKPEQALKGERPTGKVRLDAYMGFWDTRSDVPNPPPEGADPKVNASFSLSLLGMIEIAFRQVRIEAEYLVGESPKPRIKPELVNVDFAGPLQFVKKLQGFLGNLGGGFRVAMKPEFIELNYGFLLPPVSFGVFSMRNMLLQAGLMLPFADKPLRFSFNVSTFAVPFELSVMCFGGRGFLRVEIDTSGGRSLEGALEFGGNLAFDIGVASGGLYVQAGVYFKITQSQTSLAGYLRAGGNLDVLGLIHVSVEFLLMVAYRNEPHGGGSELYGTATLTVNIEMLFFSISVNVTLEKRIAGSKKEDGGQRSVAAPANGEALGAAAALAHSLILLQPPQGPPKAEPPRTRALDRTYFERSDFRTDEPPKGRFCWDDGQPAQSARRWVQEYWSQFDLTAR